MRPLESAARRANLRVTEADLAGQIDPALQAVWDRESKDATLPRAVLRYPDSGAQIPSVWSGPLEADLGPLMDSPARRLVFNRLTSGHAGAIVLLLSGNAAADGAAREFLQKQLPRIEAAIALPAKTDEGPQVQSELPLWITFPVVEIARTESEEAFVRILLGSEDGLADVAGPIAFPVFGRGRALCSLHGKDISDPAELQRSLEFICKACSCQVKELNPGVDLLMSANWEVIFDAERGPAPRILTSGGTAAAESRQASAGFDTAAELRSAPPAGYSAAELEPAPRQTTGRSPLFRLGTVAAGLLVLITGFWAFRGRRSPPRPDS
jgi:hypothetical protein